ncbi:Speckle-type POZ protein-like protein [Aphelenchoides fujianensis]|nr:Speckle-type POZ protein-like protein [Aphelenchoides fujianensis]
MSAGTEKLLSGLAAIYGDGIHWDFVVTVDGVEIKILKSIVGIHSEVFERMFAADMREGNTNKVDIKNYSPQVINCLLRYCYTGTLEDSDMMPSGMLAEVYRAAHCYQMAELVEECKRQAVEQKSEENVLEWLVVGFTYEDDDLMDEFLDFFLQHNKAVQALPQFVLFVGQHPSIAVELFRRVSADRNALKNANHELREAKQQRDKANKQLEEVKQQLEEANRRLSSSDGPHAPLVWYAPSSFTHGYVVPNPYPR